MAVHFLRSAAIVAAILLATPCQVSASPLPFPGSPPKAGHWVDTWTSMPQLTEPANLPPAPFNGSTGVFQNATIRQTIHTSLGGDQIRIRVSNVFGGSDLTITSMTVALPANGAAGVSAIQPKTLQTVKFSGDTSFTVPNGALAVSDPLNFKVAPQSMVAITLYLARGQQGFSVTSHPGSRTTSFFSSGNQVSATNVTNEANAAHWYFLSAVEVWAPKTTTALAIVGDSITDGRGSTDNANNRWPDLLLANMQKGSATAHVAVVNQAAGGNRILADGLGPNALGRIERDVLAQSGIKYALIFEGVNDIGTAATDQASQTQVGDSLLWAFEQIALRVHTAGIPIFAATITPFGSPDGSQAYSNPVREATRQRVNKFIKTSGVFDAVVDFDAIVRDPHAPSQLLPKYNSGDWLHLTPAGYQAMANAVPLGWFSQFASGVDGFN